MKRKPLLEVLMGYVYRHPEGLLHGALHARIARLTTGGGYCLQEVDALLRTLRDLGTLGCVSGLWYLRDIAPAVAMGIARTMPKKKRAKAC